MASSSIPSPSAGCIVEFLQDNRVIQAYVLEGTSPQTGGQLRLYSIGKRELKLAPSRLLPWFGPVYHGQATRKDMEDRMELHREKRKEIAKDINVQELWELAEGEVEKAALQWFAELLWPEPEIDQLIALGHKLLDFKTHFKFSPPDFEIYNRELVEKRLKKAEEEKKEEAIIIAGTKFFRILWDIATSRRGPLTPDEEPATEVAETLKSLILNRLADPDCHERATLWTMLVKSMPEEQHLPLLLAMAWGLKPPHYNFLLDRADYDGAEEWFAPLHSTLEELQDKVLLKMAEAKEKNIQSPGFIEKGFISIDPETTEDWDDAFKLEMLKSDSGQDIFHLSIALANPAWFWPFGSDLDNTIMLRASSLYLPEGSLHMMPRKISLDLFSLQKGQCRPSLVVEMYFDAEGNVNSVSPRTGWVEVSENLAHDASEEIFARKNTSSPHAAMLCNCLKLAESLQKKRILRGAVITERPEVSIRLKNEYNPAETGEHNNQSKAPETIVELVPDAPSPFAHNVVSEFMIACNAALAAWGKENKLPLIYRTQDVALPKEFAGIWSQAHEISRVIKALPPSNLELAPKPHAGLGEAIYATFTSPMRRYLDLVNSAQIVNFLENGTPQKDQAALSAALPIISSRLAAVSQVQRFRPRYWKLLYLLQQNQIRREERPWWEATVAEENDSFAMISLDLAQISVRAQRSRLGDKVYAGQSVLVRLGKINPLYNDIQVIEVIEN